MMSSSSRLLMSDWRGTHPLSRNSHKYLRSGLRAFRGVEVASPAATRSSLTDCGPTPLRRGAKSSGDATNRSAALVVRVVECLGVLVRFAMVITLRPGLQGTLDAFHPVLPEDEGFYGCRLPSRV